MGNPEEFQLRKALLQIVYRFIFSYEPPFKDDEGNEIHSVNRDFETAEERDMFVRGTLR